MSVFWLLLAATVQDAPSDIEKARAEAVKAAAEILGGDPLVEIRATVFVIVTDGDRETMDRAAGTVTRVSAALYRQFFAKRAERPLKVFAFSGKTSYDKFVRATYGKEPTTPYGFYMPSDRSMVMNLATGTGTLAHELVHPLIEEDFAAVPAWFNEGFASLFEQSSYDEDGSIRGLVNWRLRGLQPALRDGSAPKLEEVLSTSRSEFYGSGSGLNYAVARYLCLYLQEQGLLAKYYKTFRAKHKDDPSGKAVLKEVTGKSPAELQEEWAAWALKLNFER
ncbi:MAG TPA: hypothetical protein VI643_04880 [Planctomycetota bacterium]|nr:hypothetical protein [Planctomycetota bacterium]